MKLPRRSLGAPFVVKDAPWLFWMVERPSSALKWPNTLKKELIIELTYRLKIGMNKNSLHATIVRFSSSTKSRVTSFGCECSVHKAHFTVVPSNPAVVLIFEPSRCFDVRLPN